MSEKLEQFNIFLKNIDLKNYREKYSKIKTVELDLPKKIKNKRKQEIINITYQVPGNISLTLKGEERKPILEKQENHPIISISECNH